MDGASVETALRTGLEREARPGRSREGLAFSGFVGPAVLLYGCFLLVPLLHTVYLSFFEWDGASPQTFAGVQNYLAILSNADLAQAFGHSAILILIYLVGSVGSRFWSSD